MFSTRFAIMPPRHRPQSAVQHDLVPSVTSAWLCVGQRASPAPGLDTPPMKELILCPRYPPSDCGIVQHHFCRPTQVASGIPARMGVPSPRHHSSRSLPLANFAAKSQSVPTSQPTTQPRGRVTHPTCCVTYAISASFLQEEGSFRQIISKGSCLRQRC